MPIIERRSEDGFTLVELLVALAIMSLSLAVLFASISSGLAAAHNARQEQAAATLAQSLLAEMGASRTLALGTTSGRSSEGLNWQIDVVPYGDEADRKAWGVAAARVTVTVAWHADREKRLSLSTLRILPNGVGDE